MSMSIHTLRVIALATFASGAILAGSVSALAQPGASPSGLPQASPATAGHAAAAGQPIGLPRERDYQPVPELRDVHFSFGTALIARHCDNRGATGKKNEFNMDLGEQRAQAAMNHLIAQGIHPSRITTLSYGEERPQCAEASERCWSQNRRSRFLVKPRS